MSEFLTVVFNCNNLPDEIGQIIKEGRFSASSWSHAMDDRDKYRLERDELLKALEAFDNAAKDSQTIIGFAGKALKLLANARVVIAKAKGEV